MIKRLRKLFLVILCFTLLAAPSVRAAEFDEQFYSGNDILFYDPRAAACSSVTPTPINTSSDNEEGILRFFTGKGLTLAAAAGFVGNMKQESSLNPRIEQGGKIISDPNYTPRNGVGFGLVQWTFTARQAPLVAHVKSINKSIFDLDAQLSFVWKELNGGYKDSTLKRITGIQDPINAAVIIHNNYEISADSPAQVLAVRGGTAKSVYDKWKGKIQDGTGVEGIDSTASDGADASCQNPESLGMGSGQFTDSGEVSGWSTILQNAQVVDKVYGSKLVGSGKCATIVARTWQGRVGSAYNYFYAIDAWNANPNLQHKDRSPKKGSILIYDTSNVAEHVVIYLGNNKILNDGNIVNADLLEKTWKAKYIGWMDPNDKFTGKSKGVGGPWSTPPAKITEQNAKAVIGL
jgi:hypothetical protein